MITDMLTDVIDHGTARAARGAVRGTAIAGKTGTSRDGWFVGYTPNMVCAVWIGFDDNSQLGLTGAEAALPAWTEFIKSAVDLRPELGGERFERPAGIMFVDIDPETGMYATDACPARERIAITSALAPHFECYIHNQGPAEAEESAAAYQIYENSREVNARPLPRATDTVEQIEPRSTATHVEIDRSGRATLVNNISP
jgi:penicillin-binding protein 1B